MNSLHVEVCIDPRTCCGTVCTRQLLGRGRCQDADSVGAGQPSLESQQELANIQAMQPVASTKEPLKCGECRKADSWGIPLSKTCQYACEFEPLNKPAPSSPVGELPPLPEPLLIKVDGTYRPHFTADQMRDYARAALSAQGRKEKP